MSIPNPPDPFLGAQDDVLSALRTARSLSSSYKRIRSLASSGTSPELIQARQELEASLSELSNDVQDLVDSVRAVEGDPFKFGLDVEEVGRRRQLVKSIGDEVESMREDVQAHEAKGGKGTDRSNGSNLPAPSEFDDYGNGDRGREEDDDYGAFEQQRQVEMMHDQDEQLDGVYKTVGNLRAQADTMGRELEEQAGMLDDVDNVADRVGGKLKNGIKKVGWVIQHNEGISVPSSKNGNGEVSRSNDEVKLIMTRYLVKLLHWHSHPRADNASGAGSSALKGGQCRDPGTFAIFGCIRLRSH